MFDFDLVVVGAGSGGTRASRVSAGFGARVAVVEEGRLGGTCVNVGCIPKKLFVYAAHYGEDFADAAAYGWDVGPRRFDFARLRKNKDVEIARLNGVYAKLLDDAGVTRIDGRARLVDAHTVAVGERQIRAEHILVATGGWPSLPQTPGIEHAITSNEVFGLERAARARRRGGRRLHRRRVRRHLPRHGRAHHAALPRRAVPARLRRRRAARARGRDAEARRRPALRRRRRRASRGRPAASASR